MAIIWALSPTSELLPQPHPACLASQTPPEGLPLPVLGGKGKEPAFIRPLLSAERVSVFMLISIKYGEQKFF